MKYTNLEVTQAHEIAALERDIEHLEDALDTSERSISEAEDKNDILTAEYAEFMTDQINLQIKVIEKLLAKEEIIKELQEKIEALEQRNDYLLEDLEFMESSYDDLFDDYHDMEEFYLAIIDDNDVELAETEEVVEFLEFEVDKLLEHDAEIDEMVNTTIINMIETLEHERTRTNKIEVALVETLVENDTLQSKLNFYHDRMRRIAQFCA